MKKQFITTYFSFIFFIGFLAVSCDKDTSMNENSAVSKEVKVDKAKIDVIKNADNKRLINKNRLPDKSKEILKKKYTSSAVNRAYSVARQGYEVMLFEANQNLTNRTLSSVYFDTNGVELLSNESELEEFDGSIELDSHFCFEYAYPIAFTLPGGETLTIEKDKDWQKLEEWYNNNQETEAFPEIQFPINIILSDGTKSSIENSEEEESLIEDCSITIVDSLLEGEITFSTDGTETDSEEEGELAIGSFIECFHEEYVYPITYNLPEGGQLIIENEEGWAKLDSWYENNPDAEKFPKLVYPVSLTLEGGKTVVFNTEEEELAFTNLEGSKCLLSDLLEQRLGCYDYNYPVSILLPNGNEKVTVNNKEALMEKANALIKALDGEVEGDLLNIIFPAIEYPVEIKFQNGDEVKVDSAEIESKLFFEHCGGSDSIEGSIEMEDTLESESN